MREGITAYPKDSQTNRVDLALNGRSLQVDIPSDLGGNDVGRIINFITVVHTFEKSGLTDMFGQGFEATQGTNTYRVDYDKLHDSEMIMTNMLGGTAGFDGEILAQHEIDRLQHSLRWFVPEGDFGAHIETDAQGTKERMKKVGLLDENGKINDAVFEDAADYIQSNAVTGVPGLANLTAGVPSMNDAGRSREYLEDNYQPKENRKYTKQTKWEDLDLSLSEE